MFVLPTNTCLFCPRHTYLHTLAPYIHTYIHSHTYLHTLVQNKRLFCPRTRVCFADEQNKGPTNRNKRESKSAQSYLSNYQRGQNIYEVKFFSVFYTELSNSSDSNLQMTPLAKKKAGKIKKTSSSRGEMSGKSLAAHLCTSLVPVSCERESERESERERREREREGEREREKAEKEREKERKAGRVCVCVCVCMLSV